MGRPQGHGLLVLIVVVARAKCPNSWPVQQWQCCLDMDVRWTMDMSHASVTIYFAF